MPIERRFLGWDAPVTAKVRRFLLDGRPAGPVDLGDTLVVVPTRQAGRRLREALALHCAERGSALLSPRVVTPSFFFTRGDAEPAASPAEVAAAWASVLMSAAPGEYPDLFPAAPPLRDIEWALAAGAMVQRLRDRLVDGGYLIADIAGGFESVLPEAGRWRDLARLEKAYLALLEKAGRRDPCERMIALAADPEIPEGTARLVLAAVPDPTPLTLRAVGKLAGRLPVTVLVHAPETHEDLFDGWGRPIPEKWADVPIEVPGAPDNILLSSSPSSQSRRVIGLIAGEAERFGPADIAIGVPDAAVVPYLASDLEERGLGVFNPAGKRLDEHPLFHLLDAFRALVNEGTYAGLSAFLRHPDFLEAARAKHGLSPRAVLTELDELHNLLLPRAAREIFRFFSRRGRTAEAGRRGFPALEKAAALARSHVERCRRESLDGSVRALLEDVYGSRSLEPGRPEDEEFLAAASLLEETLRGLDGPFLSSLGFGARDAREILIECLRGQSYYPERAGALIDLEGWLELPWNDAPFLIVTGMNEGRVPDGSLGDLFLPDSLRRGLKLRSDADRLARDAYVLEGLVESRRRSGRVCFIAGKTGMAGEPLTPSRLLFRCSDDALPERARKLFGDPPERAGHHPATVSFRLDPRPPADVPPRLLRVGELHVTGFRDYLSCPFRFYLKRILGMEELDDRKDQMDGLEFGSLIHDVLHAMAQNAAVARGDDARAIGDFLCAEAGKWVRKRFGRTPPLPVSLQLDSARRRLRAAAGAQAALAREGWEIIASEIPVTRDIRGLTVRGRIDRIDRHRPSGRLRILDYKTGDKADNPQKIHLAPPAAGAREYALLETVTPKGRVVRKRWRDLQLPLYLLLLDEDEFPGAKEAGYFSLPQAVNAAGVRIWEGLDGAILDSATACAGGVIDDIRRLVFWPPAERVQYDDFETLFPAVVPDCVDAAAFEAYLAAEAARETGESRDGGRAADRRRGERDDG